MVSVICHIYNEEFLLPFWLKHHREMFDYGIIIDYNSTDNSPEIVRQLVPEWDFVTTKNKYFVEPDITQEVEEYEKQLSGWKIALNVTEFLLISSLRDYCETLEKHHKAGIRTNGVVMVDHPSERGVCHPEQPLVAQKTYGYLERDVLIKPSVVGRPARSRSRLLHRSDYGHYLVGRHNNLVTDCIDPCLWLCWFGWSPFNDAMRSRKLAIQTKVSAEQKEKEEWAQLYAVGEERLNEMYLQEASRSYNLLNYEPYRVSFENWQSSL